MPTGPVTKEMLIPAGSPPASAAAVLAGASPCVQVSEDEEARLALEEARRLWSEAIRGRGMLVAAKDLSVLQGPPEARKLGPCENNLSFWCVRACLPA